ncbi:type II secretion system F family protein [Chromobacterium violaceum]|uniref:type II secretion system F family protein n=2 Tax=Chromobacterium violaceum TaxID=536 RepID=UPI0009D9EF93|nr:type II secretion system F family protein [Chromobacterium violaceum]
MFAWLRGRQAAVKAAQPSRGLLQGFELRYVKLCMAGKTRMRLYEKLGKFIGNGVPMAQALAEIQLHLSDDGKKPGQPAALAVGHWRRLVLNGQPFSKALAGWAPQNELSVLAAGEAAGRFERAVEDVLFIAQARKKINAALGGLIYPLFLLMSTCLYLYIFGVQVIPAFDAILPKENWQGAGRTMAHLSSFVQHGLLPVALGLATALALIVCTLNSWTGRLRRQADRLPPWSVYRLVVGSNFLISLAALLHAGISVPDALRLMARQAGPWYRERLLAARMQVLNGARNIGDALHRSGYQFPSRDIVIDIRSYAQLDGFEGMLDRLSRQWLEETALQLNRQMDVLRNLAIVLMGFVFMWIAAGMFDLQQQISDAASRY